MARSSEQRNDGATASGGDAVTTVARDWRRRESRQARKYFGKRLSDADHQLIKSYAQSLDMDMSDLIAPAVDEILARARAHCA